MILETLFTKRAGKKGWGVFTSKSIEKGATIEISPVVVMSAGEKGLLDQTALYNYIFDWEEGKCCMALGLVPVYNHANPSNCEYFQDYEEGTIMIKTVSEIDAGDELTLNYNGDWDNQDTVWFETL